jgi:hypothetical protein
MAKVDITIPGERIVESFTALVPQPTAPSTAKAPDVGLVELSYVNPTVLVPGPPGPPGPAGSRWYTGVGDPGALPGQFGDMYLDDVTGQIWTYNGVAWVNTGTDLSPNASELLAKIKTVDGSGSGLDADTLDGLDSLYFAPIASPVFTGDPKAPTPAPGDSDTSIATTAFVSTSVGSINWGSLPGKPATFPPTLPIAESDVTNLVSDLALKAPLASPTFTGDPKAPTPAASDNDTSVATTAFVKTAVAGVTSFPEAPVDGLTYGRKNAAWATIVGGAVVSDLAPGGPLQNGQLWFKSNSGDTYIWVDDGNSQQWVQQNLMPPATIPSNYITATAQTRNRIVNGAMQISQEQGNAASSTAATGANYYAADQFAMSWSLSPGTANSQRFSVTPLTAYGSSYITFNVVAAKAALAAGDYGHIQTVVEGIRARDFLWGTAQAKQVVLVFSVYTNVPGTYAVAIRNSATDRSYLAPFTITASLAWQQIIIVIPGDTAGTWLTDTGIGLYLNFSLAMGSNFVGVAGWQAGNKLQLSGSTNFAAANNSSIRITDVGLYLDPLATGVAPRWEMPDEAQELGACQRYWEKDGSRWSGYALSGAGHSTPFAMVEKRIIPAISLASTAAIGFPATASVAATVSTKSAHAVRSANTTAAGQFADSWAANARM